MVKGMLKCVWCGYDSSTLTYICGGGVFFFLFLKHFGLKWQFISCPYVTSNKTTRFIAECCPFPTNPHKSLRWNICILRCGYFRPALITMDLIRQALIRLTDSRAKFWSYFSFIYLASYASIKAHVHFQYDGHGHLQSVAKLHKTDSIIKRNVIIKLKRIFCMVCRVLSWSDSASAKV